MNWANIRKKRRDRLKERAQREVNIVTACRDKLGDSQADLLNEINLLSSRLDHLEGEIDLRDKSGEDCSCQLEGYKILKNRIALKKSTLDVISGAHLSLSNFLNSVDSAMDLEWYKAIIRMIPEKRIPYYTLDNPKLLYEITEIFKSLNAQLSKMLAHVHDNNTELSKVSSFYAKVNNQAGEKHQADNEELLSQIRANRRSKEAPMPISVDNKNDKKNYS